jgi:hypothetical protein
LVTLLSWSVLAAQLTPEQQAAKEKGITLYNQYKAISAEPYLEIAAKAGDREARYYLGEALRLNNRYMTKEAYKWYEAAAEQGDVYAMRRLASAKNDLCSAMGNCPQGQRTALDWLNLMVATVEPLIKQGDGEAMYLMYRATGDFEWLKKSAEAGFPYGQYWLATQYKQGEGFFFPPWDRSKKVEELLRESAESGFPVGMMMLVEVIYKKGDMEGVRYWIEKAAETGFQNGVSSYGTYLAHEPDKVGYPLDLVKGYALTSLLLELDGGGGVYDYIPDVLEKITVKMTPEQVEEAKAFAQEWKASHPPLSFFPDKLGF